MTKPLYFYNGTTFELVGPTTPQSPIAYQTSAPTAPATGDLWIDSDGDVDTYNRQLTRYYYVATAGQTSISGVDANGLTLAYVAGSEQVYVNGALQVRGVDYTATNGTSITGLSALALNDVVEVFAYTAFTVANAYTKSETDSVAAAAPGLRMVVPTSVAVGSGTGSVDAIGNVTFTTASSISVNGCFTSTYNNYLLIVTIDAVTADNVLYLKLRASGTDASTAYYYGLQGLNSIGTLYSASAANVTDGMWIMENDTGATAKPTIARIELYTPAIAQRTNARITNSTNATGGVYAGWAGFGSHTTATAYDGATLISSAGNISGTIQVYGYKD